MVGALDVRLSSDASTQLHRSEASRRLMTRNASILYLLLLCCSRTLPTPTGADCIYVFNVDYISRERVASIGMEGALIELPLLTPSNKKKRYPRKYKNNIFVSNLKLC